jgi:hypothetical protein
MEIFLKTIFERIKDPYFVVLILIIVSLVKIIFSLLKSVESRDGQIFSLAGGIAELRDQILNNREVQSKILNLIEVLIYDRGRYGAKSDS